jgi:sulfopyruvate decarboxylase TPP-binding subunit
MNVETKAESEAARWQDQVYDLLRRYNVTQFAYVPDAGHRILIDRSLADPQVHSVALTTEEEGVALLAGADLGGARRPAAAKQRRWQLHQHAVAHKRRAISAAGAR